LIEHGLRVPQGRTYLWLDNLQVSYLNTRGGEVRNLEFHLNRPLCLASTNPSHGATETAHHSTSFVVIAPYGWQAQFCSHEELFPAAKLLDLPDNAAVLRGVVDGADIRAEFRRVCVFGYGDDDADVVGRRPSLKLRSGLELY
jgi:hypothetical protein